MKEKNVKSFGVIPVFKEGDNFEILVVKNKNGGHWGLPKGTPEKGEEPLQTAKREFEEEAGIKNTSIQATPVFTENYSFIKDGITFHKTNKYFLCFIDSKKQGNIADDIEVTRWINIKNASTELTYPEVISVIKQLESYLEKGV